jgi:probable HAF family extracellular repeat protein
MWGRKPDERSQHAVRQDAPGKPAARSREGDGGGAGLRRALAAAMVPAPGAATPQPAPAEITVTEITGPEGIELGAEYSSEISERGSVLVTTEDEAEPFPRSGWAVWRPGSLTPLTTPDDDFVSELHISTHDQVVATAIPCAPPVREECSTAYLWTNGRRTEIPRDGFPSLGIAINDRGQVLVGRGPILRPPFPGVPDPPWGIFEPTAVWDGRRSVTPPPSGRVAFGQDINNRGQVVLRLTDVDRDGDDSVAIWHVGGRLVDLGTPPGHDSEPVDINDRGHVAGTVEDGVSERAVLWRDGEVVDLGTPGGCCTGAEAVAINEWDEVVGHTSTPEGVLRAFIWRRGRTIDLGTLGDDVRVTALNDRGQVVGYSDTGEGPGRRAFLWQDGRMVDLGALVDGDANSEAFDINNRGQIVGRVAGRPVIWTVRAG